MLDQFSSDEFLYPLKATKPKHASICTCCSNAT